MSVKRQATTELNHDNWDKDDEPEESEGFKIAPKEVLEKRVIRTAKRRSNATNTEVFFNFTSIIKLMLLDVFNNIQSFSVSCKYKQNISLNLCLYFRG